MLFRSPGVRNECNQQSESIKETEGLECCQKCIDSAYTCNKCGSDDLFRDYLFADHSDEDIADSRSLKCKLCNAFYILCVGCYTSTTPVDIAHNCTNQLGTSIAPYRVLIHK